MTTSRVNAMLRAVGAATAAFGVGAFLAGSATAAPWIMTFERMTTVAAGGADIANADVVDGQVVTNMWGPGSLNGIPGSDSRVSVTILAGSNGNDVDRAVVYNSRPGTGRDPDLEARRNGATGFTYHGAEGAPVVASVDPQRGNGPDGKSNPGNILIIQENSDGCGDDVCNEPDDEAHGGKLTFVFDVPTSIFSIDVIDIEGTENSNLPGSEISFFADNDETTPLDATGVNIAGIGGDGDQLFVPTTDGDNKWRRITFNVENVIRMTIGCRGSCAFDNIRGNASTTNVPEPGGLGLIAGGLIGMAWMRRRRSVR